MGSCFSRCFGGRDARCFSKNIYYDRANSVEFESLMDEMPRDEPLSVPVITEFEKCVLAEGKYDLLINVQNDIDDNIFEEMARHEEMLELEEEAFIDARQEAARMARLASGRQQIINPARLLLRTTCSYESCHKDDDEGNQDRSSLLDPLTHPSNFLRARAALNRGYVPESRSRTESTSSSVNEGSCRERINSTPPSSVDLEWEHEAGFYLANCQSQKTEDDLTVPTAGSEKCATPSSNDFEWDDGFASPDLVDLETEQLINEIEQLTNEALRDTGETFVR